MNTTDEKRATVVRQRGFSEEEKSCSENSWLRFMYFRCSLDLHAQVYDRIKKVTELAQINPPLLSDVVAMRKADLSITSSILTLSPENDVVELCLDRNCCSIQGVTLEKEDDPSSSVFRKTHAYIYLVTDPNTTITTSVDTKDYDSYFIATLEKVSLSFRLTFFIISFLLPFSLCLILSSLGESFEQNVQN